MKRAIASAAICCALLVPISAFAQQPSPSPTPLPSPTPKPANPPHQSLWSKSWIAVGTGYAAARAGCATCDREGVVTKSYPILVDAGVKVTPRVDAGLELYWVRLKVNDEDPIQTTFILGVVQMRPWVDRGLFLRAGMGIGIVGNGLFNPNGPALAPPYTTNALAINFGVGWEFKVSRHFGFQVHGMQHVAALGELTTEAGERIRNVVGNYWTIGAAIVIR
jgi:hypothetical protein